MSLLKEVCKKCGHERILRTETPQRCPKCGHEPQARIYNTKNSKKASVTPRQENHASQPQTPIKEALAVE
jgi:predicted RNA-binding Zn-ribbon protein involved in translation (DUF1610 family)